MGFRLMQTSMTLNDLERCNSPYLEFFSPNSTAVLPMQLRHSVEDGPIMSVKILHRFQVMADFWSNFCS